MQINIAYFAYLKFINGSGTNQMERRDISSHVNVLLKEHNEDIYNYCSLTKTSPHLIASTLFLPELSQPLLPDKLITGMWNVHGIQKNVNGEPDCSQCIAFGMTTREGVKKELIDRRNYYVMFDGTPVSLYGKQMEAYIEDRISGPVNQLKILTGVEFIDTLINSILERIPWNLLQDSNFIESFISDIKKIHTWLSEAERRQETQPMGIFLWNIKVTVSLCHDLRKIIDKYKLYLEERIAANKKSVLITMQDKWFKIESCACLEF